MPPLRAGMREEKKRGGAPTVSPEKSVVELWPAALPLDGKFWAVHCAGTKGGIWICCCAWRGASKNVTARPESRCHLRAQRAKKRFRSANTDGQLGLVVEWHLNPANSLYMTYTPSPSPKTQRTTTLLAQLSLHTGQRTRIGINSHLQWKNHVPGLSALKRKNAFPRDGTSTVSRRIGFAWLASVSIGGFRVGSSDVTSVDLWTIWNLWPWR